MTLLCRSDESPPTWQAGVVGPYLGAIKPFGNPRQFLFEVCGGAGISGAQVSSQDHFQSTQTDEPNYSWTRLVSRGQADLADRLAAHIVAQRCPEHYCLAWEETRRHGSKLFGKIRTGFEHVIAEVLQLPESAQSPPPQDVQGYVGEALWHLLSIDHDHGFPAVLIEFGWNPADPGGDGLIVHQQGEDFSFRLWEIKKTTVAGGISSTVNRASKQVESRAPKYLARWTNVCAQKTDGRLREFFDYLLDHWYDASEAASVGVAIASGDDPPPSPCFHQLPGDFPDLCVPSRLRGLLTQVEDFEEFCESVRESVWTAL